MRLLFMHDTSLQVPKANNIGVVHMCSAFAELGEDVTLAVPASGGGSKPAALAGAILGRKAPFTVREYRTLSLPRFGMVTGWFGMLRVIRSMAADWCFTRSPLLLELALNRRYRCVYEAHNSFIHKNRLIDRWLTRKVVHNSRSPQLPAFIAISEALGRIWIRKGIAPEKMLVLHDAIDAECYRDLPGRASMRHDLGIREGEKLVVYAGGLYPDRGVERVFDLADEFPRVRFLLLGGPVDRAEVCRGTVAERNLGNVLIRDRVPHPEVKEYLAAADVLLMLWSRRVPTIDYCSPLKLFEYMATGKIIVGDGYPTIREVVRHGEHALLSTPEDFPDLKRQLGAALEMGYPNSMGEAARSLAMAHYTWQQRARRILEKVFPTETLLSKCVSLRHSGASPEG